ncbi:MAG: HAD family hydrolase [SAR202 cluster bacterium]|nr:HAD family hydrolase [SAR202 cluster bacterium]
MTNNIDTVIFDLDGTLVDSQPAALGATIEALSRFGVQVTAAELREVFGGGARKLLHHFLDRDLGSDQAGQLLEDAVQLRSSLQLDLTSEVVLLSGVKELLALLQDGKYRLAVATMSTRVVVDSVLGYHSINAYFDAILTVDDVTQGKPDPEILTKTVDRLGGQVNRTVYVGDSSHDMEAAVQLGMPFLLVDSGIYIRGAAREKLHAAAEQNGFPIVGLDELSDIGEIVQR